MKIVIVGGVAGGATAAARLRRLNEKAEIIIFERNEHISFANCGLPYYIGEVITDRNKLEVQTVEGLSKRFNLDIRNFTEVTNINKEVKKITAKNILTGEEYTESYDKLILSPGARPLVFPIEGMDNASNIFTLRNIPDTDKIYEYTKLGVKHAVVVGGGFIGIEVAENLVHRGIKVSIINLDNQIMAPADYEMAKILHEELEKNSVELVLEDSVKEFRNNGKLVITNKGKEISTDMVIMAIGVTPESKLALDAGLEMTGSKSIKVDEFMQTSDKDIYAVGDAIEVSHFIDGKPTRIPLAWPANRQGKIVADTISGKPTKYNGTQWSSVIKIFDLTFASTGYNEKQLKRDNVEYEVVYANRGSHAGYYPGAKQIQLKLIYRKSDHLILGAQAIGEDGVDKRIDVIATAIRYKGKVTDLADIELCYAPPFNSAKDPVNILGYIAENIIEGIIKNVHWHEIDSIVSNGATLIDVRTHLEYSKGNIEGSINVELDILRNNLNQLPEDKTAPIYITCAIGHRGYIAASIIRGNGYTNVYNLAGGYELYRIAKK